MAETTSASLAGAPERPATSTQLDDVPRGRRLRAAREGARTMTPHAVIARAARSRTCAAAAAPFFPTGRKARSSDATRSRSRCTSSSTPTSRSRARSRTARSWRRVPHRLIEGCLIAAHAIESKDVFIYIRGEYLDGVRGLSQGALDEAARKAGILGDVEITVHRGAGAYICGEETALLESLEGKRGQPRSRPPFPPISGLYMAPTLINNVSTIATVPLILDVGAEEYAKIGAPDSTGHRDLLASRATSCGPATTSSPLGTTMRELIYDIAGGDRRRSQAEGRDPGRLVGAGADARPDRHAARLRLARQRSGRSSAPASLIVVDDRCCMVQLALRSTKFYMHESCGKCTPCRVGTRWMVQILESIEDGTATRADLDLLDSTSATTSSARSSARSASSPSIPVASYLTKWRDEFVAHVDARRLPVRRRLVARGDPRAVDQHAHTPAGEEALV